MDETMKVATPASIRTEWLQGAPQRVIMDTSGTVLVTYDPATRSGGVHRIEQGMWLVIGPMTLGEFAAALSTFKVQLPDVHDLQIWLDAVSALDPLQGVTRQ